MNSKNNLINNHEKQIEKVDQITFSGKQALKQEQKIVYVTERALFRLTELGLLLEELAPGVDLQKDVLEQMNFTPTISPNLKTMDSDLFREFR